MLLASACPSGPLTAQTADAGAVTEAQSGDTDVKPFSGGIKGWKAAGEKVATADLCPKCGQPQGSAASCQAK